MKIKKLFMKPKLLIILFSTLFNFVWSQENSLALYNSENQKTVELNAYQAYTFILATKEKVKGRISDFDLNTITISNFKGQKINIDYEDILKIKGYLIKDRRNFELFGVTGLFSAIFLVVTPFAYWFGGAEEGNDALIMTTTLAAITGIGIILGSLKKGYNLQKNWEIKYPYLEESLKEM